MGHLVNVAGPTFPGILPFLLQIYTACWMPGIVVENWSACFASSVEVYWYSMRQERGQGYVMLLPGLSQFNATHPKATGKDVNNRRLKKLAPW
jgi:hypothetical protein